VPLDITAEELILASSAVSAVLIVSHSGRVKAPTTSVVITFDKTKEVPQYVRFGYLSFKTKLYIPRPLRCYTRQPFDHSLLFCEKSKKILDPPVLATTVMTPAPTKGAHANALTVVVGTVLATPDIPCVREGTKGHTISNNYWYVL